MNESLIGTTPALFTVERSQLKPSFPLRLEKDGYEPYEGEIRSRVAGGRATAAFFTLGIVYLFRSPRYLAFPEMVNLEPSLEAETDRRLGRQLRELEELLDEGRITREEYETRRRRLFGEP